ncbi:MAG: hypothetical protein QW057_07975 [Candidatus Bathyarchaeia archaeon]
MRAPADGAYDSRRKYAYLAGKGVEPAMKPRGAAPGKPGAAGPGNYQAFCVWKTLSKEALDKVFDQTPT